MNSNYTTNKKSTDELKQQVREDINKVKNDFDEIKQRMTPGQFIDDIIFTTPDRSPAVAFEHLKTNPTGTSLLTLGALLLMENDQHQTYESVVKDKVHAVKDKFGDAMHTKDSKIENIKSKVSTIKTKTHDAVEVAKNLDPLTYLALGAGLGTITGASLPISEAESRLIDSQFENSLSHFSFELEEALNKSVNILKNEFIGGLTEVNLQLF